MTNQANNPASDEAIAAINKAARAAAATTSQKTAPTNGILNSKRVAHFIDPRTITRREGWNPRFEFGEIAALAISIQQNGVLNSIRVKRLPAGSAHQFELIDGDRRLTAIEQILKKNPDAFPDGIPAVIVDKDQDDITSLIQMFEANSGKVFLPLEEAAAYDRMRQAGLSIKQICAKVGRASVHVTEILNLLKADESVKEAVATGKIGKTMAKQIATAARGDTAKQKELVAKATEAAGKGKGNRRAVLKAVDDQKVAKAKAKGKTLKIRALSDIELSQIGAAMATTLAEQLKSAGLALDADLTAWVKNNQMYIIAYAFGALEALKVAAGQPDNLIK